MGMEREVPDIPSLMSIPTRTRFLINEGQLLWQTQATPTRQEVSFISV